MAPTQVSPEEEDEWALTPRDRSMMGRVSSRILCWAEAEEEMPDKKDLPSWMAPKHLRHTKRLVQAARAKDQVQVLRGTNQKKQLEQRAWELVFNMFLLKPKMEEELKKEQERVLSEAVEKGHDASSLEIMVEDSSGIRRPMQMQLQRTFSRGGGALGPGGMYRSRSMHPGADSQSFIRRSRSRLSSITDLTQSSFIARTRSAGGEWAAVQTASFIARTRPGDRSAPSKLEDICVPQLQRGDAGFALSGMASIVESMPEGASHSKPLELNVVPFDGLDSLRGGSTDNLDGPPQVVRLFVREEVMTYKMKYETAKRDLFELLKNEESQREEPDPVGAIPLHACFLLGLSDIGQELVEEFYHEGLHRCDLNTPYTSDLEPWKKLGVLDKDDPYDDGGLYTGETCLHIAIVQSKEEDTRLVSWMLEHGAQVHARATGAFFKGKVIKFRADHNENSSKWWRRAAALWLRLTSGAFQTDHGYRRMRTLNNAYSACDYGEYPLSFAASVGSVATCKLIAEHKMWQEEWDAFVVQQREVVRALERHWKIPEDKQRASYKFLFTDHMAMEFSSHIKQTKKRGLSYVASTETVPSEGYIDLFMNAQDSSGNTALHMAVIHNKIETIDWLFANGAAPSLRLLNQDGLTPFTLAAKLGNAKVLHHILKTKMKTTEWNFGSVSLSKMSLEQMDSFRVRDNDLHDMPNWRSAIEIIVDHEVIEFAKDELFNKLILEKWHNFGRARYIKWTLMPYVIFIIVFTVTVILRCIEVRNKFIRSRDGHLGDLDGETLVQWSERVVWNYDRGGISHLEATQSYAVVVLHFLLGIPGNAWLFWKGWTSRRISPRDLDPEEDGHRNYQSFVFKNMTFILNTVSSFCILISFVARCAGDESTELDAWAIASIITWSNLLVLFVPFQFFGYIIITTYRMLISDIVQFAAAYVFITLGFSFGIFALYQMTPFPDDIHGLNVYPFQSTLNYFFTSMADHVEVDFSLSHSPGLFATLHLIYIMLAAWLLLNLLIAMMGQTFEKNAEDTHRTWIFPFASLVLAYEKSLSEDERCDSSGLYRSGKFSGYELPTETNTQEVCKDAYYRAVFYETNVGADKERMQEEERRRAYQKEYRAVVTRLETTIDDSKHNIAANRQAEAPGSARGKPKDMQRRLDEMIKELQSVSRQKSKSRASPVATGVSVNLRPPPLDVSPQFRPHIKNGSGAALTPLRPPADRLGRSPGILKMKPLPKPLETTPRAAPGEGAHIDRGDSTGQDETVQARLEV